MSELIQVAEDNFQTRVLQSGLPVLVDFGAAWCAPCKRLDPIVHAIAQEWDGKLILAKIDAELCPDIVQTYEVMSLPTLILFKGGKPVERLTGMQTREKIIAKFASYL